MPLREEQTLPRGAFWSYARFDDTASLGQLSKLRDRLSEGVQALTGKPFPIWFDRNDIEWGAHWEKAIEGGLNQSLLLIPILTPSWHQSDACRGEYNAFREIERARRRDDLILPIEFIKTEQKNPSEYDVQLVKELQNRQYEGGSTFRFLDYDSQKAMEAVDELARRLIGALDRTAAPVGTGPRSRRRPPPEAPLQASARRQIDVEAPELLDAELVAFNLSPNSQLTTEQEIAFAPDVSFGETWVSYGGFRARTRLNGAILRLEIEGGSLDYRRAFGRVVNSIDSYAEDSPAEQPVRFRQSGATGGNGRWEFFAREGKALANAYELTEDGAPGVYVTAQAADVTITGTISCEPRHIEVDLEDTVGRRPKGLVTDGDAEAALSENRKALWKLLVKEELPKQLSNETYPQEATIARQRAHSSLGDEA